MEIPKELNNEIWDYCRLNNITAIDDFTIKLIKQGFTVEKFGATPVTKERIVEKIVDKIIEVPIEKIVEKIVEVPVQMVDEEKDRLLRESILQSQQLSSQVDSLNTQMEKLKSDLELEKQKNRKDFYGER
jgi:FKBP-type peptidyl-prolyl cis-trans isomerase (trigger factor)